MKKEYHTFYMALKTHFQNDLKKNIIDNKVQIL